MIPVKAGKYVLYMEYSKS